MQDLLRAVDGGRRLGLEHHQLADPRRDQGRAGADAPGGQRGAGGARAHAWASSTAASSRSCRPSITQPDEADRQHLIDVVQGQRPAGLLPGLRRRSRGAGSRRRRSEGAQLTALLRAIPFNPRFTLKKTTFFGNLDVWDVMMAKPLESATGHHGRPGEAGRAARGGHAAPASPARRARAVHPVELDHRQQGRARQEPCTRGQEADRSSPRSWASTWPTSMLDLAVEEKLETEFQLQSRPPENDVALAEYVRSGHALPSQSDAGAHLNTNYCTAGESSYVLGEWVRERRPAEPGGRHPPLHVPAGAHHGARRPRARARGHGGRPHGVRPGQDRREGRRGLARRPRRHAATRAGRGGRGAT